MAQKKKPSEAEKKAQEYIEHLQRLQAEFENYKKRTERERQEAAGRASTNLIMRLLPVADDLDRAIEAAGGDEAAAGFADGLILIRTHFLKVLADEGVEEIPALGQPFDPHLHEAVMQEPSEEHPDDHVCEVLRKGYRAGDIVLRPAMVKIASSNDA